MIFAKFSAKNISVHGNCCQNDLDCQNKCEFFFFAIPTWKKQFNKNCILAEFWQNFCKKKRRAGPVLAEKTTSVAKKYDASLFGCCAEMERKASLEVWL
jgi:hypothetical protein